MTADLVELDEFMAQSNARARRGREIARLMFATGAMPITFVAFLFVAQPNFMYENPEPNPMLVIMLGLAVLGLVVGLAWMWRILRADHEPDAKAWRYRDR